MRKDVGAIMTRGKRRPALRCSVAMRVVPGRGTEKKLQLDIIRQRRDTRFCGESGLLGIV
jgi:hypothetical protein